MHEIMEKTYELIDCLDHSSIIEKIDYYKKKIEINEEIGKLLSIGNSDIDSYSLLDIKKKLYQFDEYREYMNCYNELMYLVIDINYRYKKLIGKGSCF